MSQILTVPNLSFTETSCFDPQQRCCFVAALSQRKQNKIMEGIGCLHSQDQPFPTWMIVGQALSKAFDISALQLKSTMELHHRDYLLFEKASIDGLSLKPGTAPERIPEVDFGTQSDHTTWLGHCKIARPVVPDLVRNCKVFMAMNTPLTNRR